MQNDAHLKVLRGFRGAGTPSDRHKKPGSSTFSIQWCWAFRWLTEHHPPETGAPMTLHARHHRGLAWLVQAGIQLAERGHSVLLRATAFPAAQLCGEFLFCLRSPRSRRTGNPSTRAQRPAAVPDFRRPASAPARGVNSESASCPARPLGLTLTPSIKFLWDPAPLKPEPAALHRTPVHAVRGSLD